MEPLLPASEPKPHCFLRVTFEEMSAILKACGRFNLERQAFPEGSPFSLSSTPFEVEIFGQDIVDRLLGYDVELVLTRPGQDIGPMGLQRVRLRATVSIARSEIAPDDPSAYRFTAPRPLGFEPGLAPDFEHMTLAGTIPLPEIQEAALQEFEEYWKRVIGRMRTDPNLRVVVSGLDDDE